MILEENLFNLAENKGLFKPRNLSGKDNRYLIWNKQQPIIDGVQINQYDEDGQRTGRWGEGEFYGGDTLDLLETYWEVFEDTIDYLEDEEDIFDELLNIINTSLEDSLSEYGPLSENWYDLTIPLRDERVWDKCVELRNNENSITENLFKPRNLDRWEKWNSEQPEKEVNGGIIKINQYDSEGRKQGYWEFYWDDGVIEGSGYFKNGVENGYFKNYYYDGELESEGKQVNGEELGEHIYYNHPLYGGGIWIKIDYKKNGYSESTHYTDGKPTIKTIRKNGTLVSSNPIIESVDKKILKSFIPKKELNPKIWNDDDTLKYDVRETLLSIADKFYETLEIEVPVEDIMMTGSLANYNWSEYSDIDLHIHIDFSKLKDEELSKKYFDAKKYIWNNDHDITIKGYEVELYVQDVNENHESTGVYSVMNNDWVDKPKPMDVKIDKGTIKTKVNQFNSDFSFIQDDFDNENYEGAEKELTKLKEKIKKYRQAGLDAGGEMSTENLVFKVLRRSKFIEKLYNLGLKIVDREFTLEENLFKVRNLDRWDKWNSKQPIVDGVQINQYDKDGIKQGYWKEVLQDDYDEFYCEGDYKNGKEEGEWLVKYDFGGIKEIINYKNGDYNGIWVSYDKDGKIWVESHFDMGKEIRLHKVMGENIKDKVSSITDYIKQFKDNFSLDVSFLLTFGSAINGIISNLTTLINESSLHPLTTYEKINLAIAIFSIYLKNKNSLINFKNELLTITAFATLIPTYSNIINGLVGNIDFMESLKNMGKGLSIYGVLTSLKKK